ncbi:serine palmitoyltransferase 1 [Neodiprion pinetum]|uniref:serine palmitoyltransferase 1 n=1 Tax=Neodiprion pinetum TaxID=441929 RepID=UPI001EDEF501|nr:serine palmitoyltransferase 1 [Neodiprion pinetum]
MSSKFIFLESVDLLSTIPQYHLVLGTFLLLWVAWLTVKRRYNNRQLPELSNDEVERKIANWQPEPLVKPIEKKYHHALKPKLVSTKVGKRITVNGKDCLNLGTHNYLGFVGSSEIEDTAIAAIEKYGVGSCGPRGFYGTVDVHLELEEKLAKFMELEEAIVYSYGFTTIASAIPAYCKRRDLVFVDEKINFSIQKGLDASRSNVKYFKHNDADNLKNLLTQQAEEENKNPKRAAKTRRFLIVEGIYMNTGEICPLPDLVKLCREYKLRIFIDESISFGVLGKHGRGVTEHFGVPRHEIDMIMGSLDWAVASIGGFCVGSSYIIEHQRLSGLGYCFSASLPPFLTSAATKSLQIMERNTEIFDTLKQKCLQFDARLKELTSFCLSGFAESPVKHLYLKEIPNHADEWELLNLISDKCIDNNIAVIVSAYLETETTPPRSSLRICVSVVLEDVEIEHACQVIEKCTEAVLSSVK